jgi:ATP-dependent DNA helicase RecG
MVRTIISGTFQLVKRRNSQKQFPDGEAGLPEPEFRQKGGQFVQTVWRNWLTIAVMNKLALNERQKKAVAFVKTNERITNTEYQEAFQVAKRTAHRDLNEMVSKGVLQKVGTTGKGAFYTLRKGAT